MSETVLIGHGKGISEMPRQAWEEALAGAPERIAARLDFMTEEHHLILDFVVRELPRFAAPIPPELISRQLGLPLQRTQTILDELERSLFFLVSNDEGGVSWAFPGTVDSTGHHLTFSTGDRLDAA